MIATRNFLVIWILAEFNKECKALGQMLFYGNQQKKTNSSIMSMGHDEDGLNITY